MFCSIAVLIFRAKGQGYPIGVPSVMHDARAMVSAPRRTISLALKTAFFPGQPPHEMNPTISMSSATSLKASCLFRITLKSLVPGQVSSVCMQRIIPTFMILPYPCGFVEWIRKASLCIRAITDYMTTSFKLFASWAKPKVFRRIRKRSNTVLR